MEIMIVVIIVIIMAVVSAQKTSAQQRKEQKARMQQQERTRMTTNYSPAPAASAAQVPGQVHLSDVLPDKKPPAVPVVQKTQSAQMPFDPTEGVAFHPPGFHGDEKPRVNRSMERKPLEKEDLGAQRARQNAHTAANAEWKAPVQGNDEMQEKAQGSKPMFTPKQLRDAFIMQEILDEPVSRRKGIRRGYGS